MSYISREHALTTCVNMKSFYSGIASHFKDFGIDIESNRGRRNILMSEPMESFLATALSTTLHNVDSDGRTGKADIVITSEDGVETELECKLTSPHTSSGTITFQTDFETLEKKGSIDYIYIVADETFDKFCAIYFKGLTVNDFRDISPGARGKVQMYKHRGMKKATMLLGMAIDINEVSMAKYKVNHDLKITVIEEKIKSLEDRLSRLRETQVYVRNKTENSIAIARNVLSKKINKFNKDIIIKSERTSRYTYKFESLEK